MRGVRGPRKGIAVTQLCSEYGESVWCGLYFVDYSLAPSDPTSNEIPALHPSSGLGNQLLRLRAVRGSGRAYKAVALGLSSQD